MMNIAVRLTSTDESQHQDSYNTDIFSRLITARGYKWKELAENIERIISDLSERRSYFCFNYSKREPALRRSEGTNPIVFYGVKGMMQIARSSKYVELFSSKPDDLKGAEYHYTIMDAPYIEHEKVLSVNSLSELESTLGQGGGSFDGDNREELRSDAENVLLRLLEEYESDSIPPRAVIWLEDAETTSMPFLDELYRLLPFRIRKNLGFMTNVTSEDIRHVKNNSLPIYIMTMDMKDMGVTGYEYLPENGSRENDPHLVFINPKNPDIKPEYNHPDSPHRQMLEMLRWEMGALDESFYKFLDNAEEKYIIDKEESVSLKDYCSIVERIWPWWQKQKLNNINSVEQLIQMVIDQDELLKKGTIRTEAIDLFHKWLLSDDGGDLYGQILDISRRDDYPARAKLLKHLRDDLGLDKVVEKIKNISEGDQAEIKKLKTDVRDLQSEVNRLSSKNKQLETNISTYQRQVEEKEKEIDSLNERIRKKDGFQEAPGKKTELDEGHWKKSRSRKASYDHTNDDRLTHRKILRRWFNDMIGKLFIAAIMIMFLVVLYLAFITTKTYMNTKPVETKDMASHDIGKGYNSGNDADDELDTSKEGEDLSGGITVKNGPVFHD